MPGIRLVVMAQKATRRLSRTAVASSGERCSNSAMYRSFGLTVPDVNLLKDGEALLLKDRAGGGRFEKGNIARSAGIVRSPNHGNRINDRRVGTVGKRTDDLHALIGIC